MTQEEKQLLLKDLCARLPYGVKVCVGTQYDIDNDITDIALLQGLEFDNPIFGVKVLVCAKTYSGSNTFGTDIEEIKPYLRPMESMTEEEAKEIATLHDLKKILSVKITDEYINVIMDDGVCSTERMTLWYDELVSSIECFDWLNKKMFDYRGLIPMGLALPAPEGMYND